MAKNHNKPLNATTTLETTSQMREVSTVKLFNEVAKQKNSDKLKNMQMTQKDIMNKIINLDPSKEQKGSDFQIKGNPTGASSTQKEEEDKNDFKLVRSRRRRSTTIQGAAQGAELTLKGIPSYGYLHIYRLDPGTTEDELVSYLTNKNIKYPSCTKLVAKHPEIYSSFKIQFDINDLEKLQKPDFWPRGSRVNRFFHRIPQQEKPV